MKRLLLLAAVISCGGSMAIPTLGLTVTANGPGQVTTDPSGLTCHSGTCSSRFNQGLAITVTAHPDTGATFAGWSDACSGTSAVCTVAMNADRQATATFTSAPSGTTHAVTVSATGSGTVTSSPAGILCPSACTANFAAGTAVTLTAVTHSGALFGGWTGACAGAASCAITLDQDASVAATFARPAGTSSLTTSVSGGTGVVSSTPAGINCPVGDCSYFFATGSQVTIVASPGLGATFNGWLGGNCGGAASCSVTLGSDTTVTALFSDGSGY